MKSFGQEFSVPLPTTDLPKMERSTSRMMKTAVEAELLLQWGSRKRLRCVRVRGQNSPNANNITTNTNTNTSSSSRTRRRLASRFLTVSHKGGESLHQSTSRLTRHTETETVKSERRKSSSPEKEERYYPTRGSTVVELNENSNIMVDGGIGKGNQFEDQSHQQISNNGVKKYVWPKLCISLSSKEKEEDFMAMKGCKLPQRPKKRAKLVQRSLLLVSPGAWLTDMCMERYQVREKKSSKRKCRGGLKAMGSIESDSE